MQADKKQRRLQRLRRISYALGIGIVYHCYDSWHDRLPLAADEAARAESDGADAASDLDRLARFLKNDYPKDDEILALDDDLVQRVCPTAPTFLTYVDAAVSFKVTSGS
jgi:hypothetical protein